MFGWKAERGAAASRERADALAEEAARQDDDKAGVSRPKVEEDDVDMFA